jgi:hypothetical protein
MNGSINAFKEDYQLVDFNSSISNIGVPPRRFVVLNSIIRVISTQFVYPRNELYSIRLSA